MTSGKPRLTYCISGLINLDFPSVISPKISSYETDRAYTRNALVLYGV